VESGGARLVRKTMLNEEALEVPPHGARVCLKKNLWKRGLAVTERPNRFSADPDTYTNTASGTTDPLD
jgi:hypothetical protein